MATSSWALGAVFDHTHGVTCDKATQIDWLPWSSSKTERIRILNDALRQGAGGGQIVVTAGVETYGPVFVLKAMDAVARFSAFDEGNDPYGEHDFGALTIDGEKLFFKINYFDLSMTMHALDPANPMMTCRVMTIVLASEY